MLTRLQKFLADSGIASRRKSESLILAGQIKVNNKLVTTLGTKIDPQKDQVFYNNKLLQSRQLVYIMLNKPRGYTCTTRRFSQEKNIIDLINHAEEKLFPVGRLDKDSEGLIFLTNDGQFAYSLTHPKFEIEKEYNVQTTTPIKKEELLKMKNGIKDQDELLAIKNFTLINPNSVNLILTQGHKREIRRLFAKFDHKINSLKRLRIGRWKLDNLKTGQWKYFQP